MSDKINKVESTTETLSGRAGISFFMRYIEKIKFYNFFKKIVGNPKGSSKGLSLHQFLKQIMAYFIDGTDMSISGFDRKKEDDSYRATLGNSKDEMASSHQIKRFFRLLAPIGNYVYRKILKRLFIWQLKAIDPNIIILRADTMVMDNDGAQKREKCSPTYKNKKGFQPLQVTWNNFVIDAIFRAGKVHSNHGNDFIKSISKIVKLIRKHFPDKPIIVLSDTGFEDKFSFDYFDKKLGIGFICSGKKHDYIKEEVKPHFENGRYYRDGKQVWSYVDCGVKRKSWEEFLRAIYTHHISDSDGRVKLGFGQKESLIFTNIGKNKELTEQLREAGADEILKPESIIELFHSQGKHELVHRSIKEFATKEQLPFKSFGMNRAYYFLMVISYYLYEAYKRDLLEVLDKQEHSSMYPNTFRRKFIDFAGKVVSTGRQMILKVFEKLYNNLRLDKLWKMCNNPSTALQI